MTAEEKGIDITIMDAINEDDDHPGCGQLGHGGIVEFNRSYGLEDHPFILISVDWHTPTKADVLIGVYQSEDDYQNGAPSTLRTIPVGPDAVSTAVAAIAALLDGTSITTCPGCAGAGCWDCTLPVGPNTCESCAVYVPTGEHCGNERADGTSEYLCPDCYTPEGE